MNSMERVPIRILVTGTRGKSSLVRFLVAALSDAGFRTAGRITGVLPREMVCGRESQILRSSPGSAREMLWWLSTLPKGLDAVVMENSAVHPELQPMAFRWLRPTCTVLTNVRSDHEDLWGRGKRRASEALGKGILSGPVVLPCSETDDPFVGGVLRGKGCTLLPAEESTSFRETHFSLLRSVLRHLGLSEERGISSAAALPPDVADFCVLRDGSGSLASAFSANEPTSSEELFCSTGWYREETVVLYNGRADRPMRLGSFLPWLRGHPWKRVCIMEGTHFFVRGVEQVSIRNPKELGSFVRCETRVFGCGNVAGVPLEYLLGRAGEDLLA